MADFIGQAPSVSNLLGRYAICSLFRSDPLIHRMTAVP